MTEPGLLSRLFFIGIGMDSNNSIVKRKSRLVPTLIIAFFSTIVIVFFVVFFIGKINSHIKASGTIIAVAEKWKDYDYSAVYEISYQILQENPYNNAALIYHGYASFYLAVSQIETSSSQMYLDEAINSMRIALYNAKKQVRPQLEYMLGKSYFYKNTITSYYYSDLALKYLSLAKSHGYEASDIPEYMGLCYAALGQPMESISSFTEALLKRESDTLLLSIAEQYYKIGQSMAAKQYLFRIKNSSVDDDLIIKSMNLLGLIYIDEQKYDDARLEFEGILKKKQNSADAYYGLGTIYEKQGDIAKARSEWRKALKVQVNHPLTLEKMAN